MPYRFERFVFDPDRGLSCNGEPVPLEPQAFELLRYLLENADRIVTREELNERLWQGRIVSDAALSTQIRTVRRALGDDREQQKFIKTYPRRGFSFVAAVHETEGFDETKDLRPSQAGWSSRAWIGAGAATLLLIIGAATAWSLRSTPPTGTPSEPELSLAVMPFDNLSGDSTLDYLADAFTEDLITDLSRIRDAFVISRSTSFTYRNKEVDAPAVVTELGVRYVLEGSLRVDDDKVRINAQLIDGTTNSHLWSNRYERPLADLFALQNNVTGKIASVLRAELRVADNERQDPEITHSAWDYALRGNVILYNHETLADYQQARGLLTRAVELDPSISSAWTGLSFIHLVASFGNLPGVTEPNSAALSLEYAEKAVRADPMNAEPYWLVGAGYARNGQPERGMAACDTAMELNPNMDCGHVCAGLVYLAQDEPEEAIPYFQYALKLNPLFRPFTKEKYLGLAYIQSGQDELAIAALNRALAKAPNDSFANLALVAALALDGQMAEAEDALERFVGINGQAPPTITALRSNLAWMGSQTERMFDGLSHVGIAES